jgi:hypothetical protein
MVLVFDGTSQSTAIISRFPLDFSERGPMSPPMAKLIIVKISISVVVVGHGAVERLAS